LAKKGEIYEPEWHNNDKFVLVFHRLGTSFPFSYLLAWLNIYKLLKSHDSFFVPPLFIVIVTDFSLA